jgi:hypothetical protein
MKLFELKETGGEGTYAGVKFSKDTIKAIKQYGKDNQLPNRLPSNKLHSTLLYSRTFCPNYQPLGKLPKPWVGKPTHLELWPSQPDEDGNVSRCLVLRYKCRELEQRHEDLMDAHDATFDFDTYDPHITLSYDVGELDLDSLPDITETLDTIEINEEYGETLNLNWANENN